MAKRVDTGPLMRADGSGPVRLTRRNHGRGHSYRIDGNKVPGVTTILNALPKPALTKWAAGCAADEAVEKWDELAQLPLMERHARILWAHRERVSSAGLRGTRIHALGDKLAKGEPVDVPEDLRGPVEGYARFLDDWQIETWATETPVGSTRYGYAGTVDGWGHIGRLGVDALLDLKTGKGVYSETALQLAGYRYADVWQPDGPTSEAPTPVVEEAYVVHITPDGIRLLPVDVTPDLFRGFLYVQQVAKLLGQLDEERPIGDQMILEDYPGGAS